MKKVIIISIILMITSFGYSQNFKKVKPYNWMLGVYWNNVIDDGQGSKYLFDVDKSWNLPFFPSSVNIDIYLKKGMSFDLLASYNKYKLGTIIDKRTDVEGQFFSFDANFKYGFSYLMTQQWFDPFVFIGIGYTDREATRPHNMIGGVFGGGVNLMFNQNVGIQLRGSTKLPIASKGSAYIQAHAGLVFKFTDTALRTKKSFSTRKHEWGFKEPNFKRVK